MFDTLCQIAFEELHKMITPVRPKDAQLTLPLSVLVYFQFLDIFVNLVEVKNLSFKIFICYWHQGWTFSHIFVYQEYFFMVLFLSSTIVLNIILFENPFVWAFFFNTDIFPSYALFTMFSQLVISLLTNCTYMKLKYPFTLS